MLDEDVAGFSAAQLHRMLAINCIEQHHLTVLFVLHNQVEETDFDTIMEFIISTHG